MSGWSKFPYSCSRMRTSSRTDGALSMSPHACRMPLRVSLVRTYGEQVNLTLSAATSSRSRTPASRACCLPSAVRCSMWSGTVLVIVLFTLASDSPCRTKTRRRGRPEVWLFQKLLFLRRAVVTVLFRGATSMYLPSSEIRDQSVPPVICSSTVSEDQTRILGASSAMRGKGRRSGSSSELTPWIAFSASAAFTAACNLLTCTRFRPAPKRSASWRTWRSLVERTPRVVSLGLSSEMPCTFN
mmetsp:Transcript_146110/g.407076  ORF Transcript_146110/g.407076 Transcript_146110/m.407076 type:complete len:242 (+) Transcript_146110:440-1165(+)